jgi:hypothetical protein
MTSGLSNDEKVRIRQLYAEGKVGRAELLEAESKSYHGPGTCTFYGTANSNQMLMEIMGLHMPGVLHQSGHAAERCADHGSGQAGAGDHRARQRVHPGRRDDRRALDRQWRCRAACHRRVDQPHDAPGRDGAGGGDPC